MPFNTKNPNPRPLTAQQKRDLDKDSFIGILDDLNKKIDAIAEQYGIQIFAFAGKHYISDPSVEHLGKSISFAGGTMLNFRPTRKATVETSWAFCLEMAKHAQDAQKQIFQTLTDADSSKNMSRDDFENYDGHEEE